MRLGTSATTLAATGILIAFFSGAAVADTIWLDTLNLHNVHQDYRQAKANKAVEGHALSINGRKYDRGIGTHANSELNIDLHGTARRFVALAGIDDEAAGRFPVATFEVAGDGRSLWKKDLHARQPAEKIALDVSGVKVVTLSVSADSITFGHVDWVEGQVEFQGTRPASIVAIPLPPEEAEILTPPAPAAARVNGPRVYGARPNHPLLFIIPATGQRPMTFTAEGLPPGLVLDPQTGIITGGCKNLRRVSRRAPRRQCRGPMPAHATDRRRPTDCAHPATGMEQLELLLQRVSDAKVRTAADAMVSPALSNTAGHTSTSTTAGRTAATRRAASSAIRSSRT